MPCIFLALSTAVRHEQSRKYINEWHNSIVSLQTDSAIYDMI